MVSESSDNMMTIELAYALLEQQSLLKFDIKQGSTVQQAIEQSGILRQFPNIDLSQDKVGVFSKVCKLDRELAQGDRVEIYHSLLIDPKQRRREKAAKAKADKEKFDKESVENGGKSEN
ncbi:UPF0125 protein RatB [hydrothermal vent metagenome]|uniref:UPF0125 protein RatB n=1 Tax=hydrothermal vent metagenome TaxID=652676 RepID=A0A3B0YFV7_9ZZZZ